MWRFNRFLIKKLQEKANKASPIRVAMTMAVVLVQDPFMKARKQGPLNEARFAPFLHRMDQLTYEFIARGHCIMIPHFKNMALCKKLPCLFTFYAEKYHKQILQ